MNAQPLWYSTIEFRPNPADSEKDVIDLGFLLEFTTPKYWVVGAVLRAALDEGQLAMLDDLTQKILVRRSEVIANEVKRMLPFAREPGHVLALVSAANPWSINVSVPKKIELPMSTVRGATVEKVLEEYVYSVSTKQWGQHVEAHDARHAASRRRRGSGVGRTMDLPSVATSAVPPGLSPWMLPPISMMRPLIGH